MVERESFESPPAERGDAISGELAALYRIEALAVPGADEQRVFDEVLRTVEEVISCERALLCLYDKNVDQIVLRTSGAGDGRRISLAEPTILRRILKGGRPEIINDLVMDIDANSALADAMDARQLVGAPLTGADGYLGVVAALNSKRGAFSEGNLRLLTVLADRAAVAIENAQLRSTLTRQEQEIEGLHRLSRLLTSYETLERVVDESVRIACDLLACDKALLLLYDEEQGALVAHPRMLGITTTDPIRVSLSEPTLAGTVFRTDTPLISNDAAHDLWVSKDLRERLSIDSILVAPLNPGGGPIGVLNVINARDGAFDDGDMRFATLLGSRIGGVIESSRARERERALVHKLREADQTKSEFVSMLAHELKGPMTTIMGFSRLLQRPGDDLPEEKRSHLLGILAKEIERLSRLVNDLLDVSRMEAGSLRYDLQPLSLRDIVESIIEAHPSLTERHRLHADIADALPKVLGDPDRVRQVMINLLTNATRYSPGGSSVTVTAEVLQDGDDRVVQASVRDEGIGISVEDQQRVFSKFVNLPKPGWVPKGTGLGLFITKGIIEAHGGRLWVDSEQGRGSTFHFTLTVAE